MKILQGCVRYPPAPGGAETVVKAYSEGLRDLGHDVEAVSYTHLTLPTKA